MPELHHIVTAVFVIVFLYGAALLLRRQGVLREEHASALAMIVTELCLPAVIFVSLARQSVHPEQFLPSAVILGVEIFTVASAWAITAWLKFDRAQQGAVVMTSAFGSSAFLGYAVVTQAFPHSSAALGEAVLISEIGVGYPLFIFGPLLAAYFGHESPERSVRWRASLGFFRSPVFFALILGLLWNTFGFPSDDNIVTAPFFRVGDVLAAALTPLAVLSVGLMFKMPKIRSMAAALLIVVALKLIAQPLLSSFLAVQFGFPELWKALLVLLSAMPPAVLGAVFLQRYGREASLASALLLAATLASSVTLVAVFRLAG